MKYSEFPHTSHEHMKTLMTCYSICASCAKMCIQENSQETAFLCSDCADICALAIKWHSSESKFSEEIFSLCKKICQACADACGKMESEHCKQCSEACLAFVKAS